MNIRCFQANPPGAGGYAPPEGIAVYPTQADFSMETCLLPGGYIDPQGNVHTEASITPLSGQEEELLANSTETNSARLVSKVLATCVTRIGTIRTVTPDVVRQLLVADRQYLLLRLRRITFGPDVQSSVYCPWPDCSSKVDINFSIDQVPVKKAVNKGDRYAMALPRNDDGRRPAEGPAATLRFRLPVGADQEALHECALGNEAQALSELLDRCVVEWPEDIPDVRSLSPAARMEIEKLMERSAPAVNLAMDARCPDCGRGFTLPFDLQDFFFGELRISQDLLFREVHYLAYHYHWSEGEILSMSREKRRNYIRVLADEIERINNEAV
jgi:hypothetical protein